MRNMTIDSFKQIIKTSAICIEQIGKKLINRESPECVDASIDAREYWTENLEAWRSYKTELEARLGNSLTTPDK